MSLGADRYLRIGSSTNYWWDFKSVSNDLQLLEAGTTSRLIVKAGGNVLIGTTTDDNKGKIQVSDTGTSGVTGHLSFYNDNNAYTYLALKSGNNTTLFGTHEYGNGYVTATNALSLGSNHSSNSSRLWLGNNSRMLLAHSDGTEYLRVSNTGNLLLGTTTDSGYKLQVTTANNNDGFRLNYPSNNSTQYPFYIGKSDDSNYLRANASIIALKRNGATSTIKTEGSSNDLTLQSQRHLIFNTSDANERARITSGGNVLIGTTSDSGQKLQVNGSITGTSAEFSSDIDIKNNGNANLSLSKTDNDQKLELIGGNGGVQMIKSSYELAFYRGGSEKMRLTTNGLLIGTTTDVGVPLYVNGVIRAVGGGIQAEQDYGVTLNDESGSNRYGLKFGAAGVTGGSNLLMLTNRSFNSATGGGEVAIGGNSNTTGVTEVEIARFQPRVAAASGTQKMVTLESVLKLKEQGTPADPSSGEAVIWLDNNYDLKVKITGAEGTVTRILAQYEG